MEKYEKYIKNHPTIKGMFSFKCDGIVAPYVYNIAIKPNMPHIVGYMSTNTMIDEGPFVRELTLILTNNGIEKKEDLLKLIFSTPHAIDPNYSEDDGFEGYFYVY